MTKNFNHLGYNKELKEIARRLRKNSTPAEIRLWTKLLRAKKMKGYQFLSQRPVLNYIADFMCKELMLIIEVDGESHPLLIWQERNCGVMFFVIPLIYRKRRVYENIVCHSERVPRFPGRVKNLIISAVAINPRDPSASSPSRRCGMGSSLRMTRFDRQQLAAHHDLYCFTFRPAPLRNNR